MQLQRKKLYYLTFIKDLNFIPVILAPLVLFHGLTLSDIVFIISFFRITQMIFAIPMGFISDYYGPVSALRLASLFILLSIGSLCFPHLTLLNFCFFNFFSAISVCLLTASSSKLLKILQPDEVLFAKNFAWTLSLRRLGIMCSGLIASGLLLVFKFPAIIGIQLIFALAVLFLAFQLDLKYNFRPPNMNKMIDHLKKGLGKAPYGEIFEVALLSSSFFIAIDIFIQPLMVAAGLTKWMFPLIIALTNFLVFLSLNYAALITRWVRVSYWLACLLPLFPIVAYALTRNPIVGLIGLLVTVLMRPMAINESVKLINNNPLTNQGINDALVNTFSTGLTSSFALTFAWLLKHYSLALSSTIVVIFYILSLLIFLAIKKYGPQLYLKIGPPAKR